MLAKKGSLAWTAFQAEVARARIGTIHRGTIFSRSRFYHCVADLRCLGFILLTSNGYVPTQIGKRFARIAHYKAKHVSKMELRFFKVGLFRCAPTSRFLSIFTGGRKPRDEREFLQRSMPLRVVYDEKDKVAFRREGRKIFWLRREPEVNRLRWGAFLLCRNVGLVDDVRVKDGSGGSSLWLLPVDAEAKPSSSQIRADVERYVEAYGGRENRVEIPELVLYICKRRKVRVEAIKNLLKDIITKSRSAFYAERAPGEWVQGFEKGFIRIGDAYRSALYYTAKR